MSRSSSKTHSSHHTVHESKTQKRWKSVVAFLLFLSLAVTSLSACAKLVIVSPSSMVKLFCNEKYITSLQKEVVQYGKDLCLSSSVPDDGIEKTVTYEAIYRIEEAYVAGSLNADEQYTQTTYLDSIDALSEQVKAATDAAMTAQNYTEDADVTDGLDTFGEHFAEYLEQRINFPLMDQLQAVVNVGSLVAAVNAIVFAVFSALMIAVILSFKAKLYRSLREIVYAASAAALLDLSLVGGVALVGCFKKLVLYPTYLADAVMVYIGRCVLSVCSAAAMLLVIALILTVVIWKIKRNNNM
ncbi:MAG: hypothetical protein IJ168_08580 [Eubacterium sp.]|nr:hypothetical protein [Eubacterium sp.]